MTVAPNLQDALASKPLRSKRLDEETQQQRNIEMTRRCSAAAGKAKQALSYLYPDEYRSLYLQAVEMVNAERGPLPGDPS